VLKFNTRIIKKIFVKHIVLYFARGPKYIASHTIRHDVFDENCFIILVLEENPDADGG